MTRRVSVHPTHPQPRLLKQAAAALGEGAVVAYPTDSGYALGCHIGDKAAAERIRALRRLDPKHHFTVVCRDLSEIAQYAKVDNAAYRLLRAHTPGPYTFILPATREVPRRLQHPRRRTIGIRVPDHPVALALLEVLGEPLMSVSLIPPEQEQPLADPDEVAAVMAGRIDLVLDGGPCRPQPTTVLDLTGPVPEVLRRGAGPVDWLD